MNEREGRAREIQDAIRRVLLEEWDPIGVRDEIGCADEYYAYVGGVYRLLASGATARDVAEHLARIEEQQMGLGKSSVVALRPVASKLLVLDVRR